MTDRLQQTLELDAPVTHVAGVSSARAKALGGLGVRTVRDLLGHFPHRYLDMSQVATIAGAGIGQRATIVATVHEAVVKRPKPKLDLTEVTLVDGTGTLIATFFRQPWLAKTLAPGTLVSVAGEVEFNYGFKRMTVPFLDRLDEDAADAEGKVIPVHPACEAVSAGIMRKIIGAALCGLPSPYDPLPLELRTRYRLMARPRAWRAIHFPRSMAERAQARRRLVYEELLMLELHLMREAQRENAGAQPCAHTVDGPGVAAVRKAMPFTFTADQKRAAAEIFERMAAPQRMDHMLLGDVGTGKTAVAAVALAAAADSGTQALMMGPTEVLATQYSQVIGAWLDEAGISWALLTGSTPDTRRAEVLEGLASGAISVAFGTQALLEPGVTCAHCTLAVIDEEQRFGVEQRAALTGKGKAPDVLCMTATPIPRSLALAMYGAKTQSYLRQVPAKRPGRMTKVLGFRERGKAYDAALAACKRGEQVYVVCPLVGKKPASDDARAGKATAHAAEEPQPYIESDADMREDNLKAAQAEAAFLRAKTFSAFNVGLLHGRMKAEEKRQVMQDFRDGAIDVLVSTTVIEVGVDVPRATVMIVEDADRFGLSQLHQLRGRVGRGSLAGECYLICATSDTTASERLAAMERTEDGFELAEFDLSLRREGDILGNRQHGASALKLVNVMRDAAVIEAAHADARAILSADPNANRAATKALLHEASIVFAPAR